MTENQPPQNQPGQNPPGPQGPERTQQLPMYGQHQQQQFAPQGGQPGQQRPDSGPQGQRQGQYSAGGSAYPQFGAPGCTVVPSLADAWRAAGDAEEVCVIGGTSIFAEALPAADRIHLTEVDAEVPGDTWFPEFDRGEWTEREVERHAPDERHAYPFRIVVLERRPPARDPRG